MIELRNVTKNHEGGFTALEQVDLQISDGELVFIVGGSGAGKTTLAGLLIAEYKPTSGTITVDGTELGALKKGKVPLYRRKLGILFRDFRLFPEKTVYDNVAFALRVVGEPSSSIRMKVNAALRMVELADKGKCCIDQLSGLEQQKVALARALANGASILVADEPCGNVDPVQSRELIELFCRIQSRYQKTVVLLTHDRELAESFGKRTVYLQRGRIVNDVAAVTADEEILAEAAEEAAKAATEEAVEAPVEEVFEEAVEEVTEEALEDPVEEVFEEAVEEVAEEALEDPVEEVFEEAVEEVSEEALEDPVEEVFEEAVEEVTEEALEDPVEEVFEEAVEEVTEEAVEVVAEEAVEATAEPLQTPADAPAVEETAVYQLPTWTAEKAADGETMEVRSANISTDALESVLAELFAGEGLGGVFDAPTESASDAPRADHEEETK